MSTQKTQDLNTGMAIVAAASVADAAARAAESAQAAADHQEEARRVAGERALRGPTTTIREDAKECIKDILHEEVTVTVALADARRAAAETLGHHCAAIDREEKDRHMSCSAWEQAEFDVKRAEMYAAAVEGYATAARLLTKSFL